jgi:uncharacterized protein (DUF427 family)
MARAIWKGQVLAESDKVETVDNNTYFPFHTIKTQFFRPSELKSTCPWKGDASYYNIVVNDEINKDAAWSYPNPKEKAKHIRGYVAFWRGVQIEQ